MILMALKEQHKVLRGLGLLNVETTLTAEKTVTPTTATHLASGETISAYEIHLGRTTGSDCAIPFAMKLMVQMVQ